MTQLDAPAARADCHDDWNSHHRDELPLQRADRNFVELLQELRVAQTGVQILFGFLLTLPFTGRFANVDEFQLGVYVATLVSSAVTAALLVGPVAVHRAVFQRGRKQDLVRIGHGLACCGLAFLALTMASGLLLVLDVSIGRAAAVPTAASLAAVFVVLWVVVPVRVRVGPQSNDG